MNGLIDPPNQIRSAMVTACNDPSGVGADVMAKVVEAVWMCPDLPAISLDPGLRICGANSAAENLFGIPKEALIGCPLTDLIPDLSALGREACTPGRVINCNINGTRQPHRITFFSPSHSGTEYPLMAIVEGCESAQSAPVLPVPVNAYNAMEEILGLCYHLVSVTDGGGTGIKATCQIEKMLGTSIEEFVGHNVRDLVRRKVLSRSVTLAVLTSRASRTIAQRTKGNRCLVVTGMPVFDEQGRIVRVINFSRDITDSVILRKRIMEAQVLLATYQSELSGGKTSIPIRPGTSNWRGMVEKAARVDSTVLIAGESGVGKGVVAREIHEKSRRSNGPFVKVNCAAIPATLFESELFGHAKGAFTGAIRSEHGIVWQAGNGTLFLDEIADLPPSMQVKLLHLLEDKEYYPVGSSLGVKTNARIIAATNQDLERLMEENAFRRDLFFRLNVLSIKIPPLRERLDEIPDLVEQFLNSFNSGLSRLVSLEPGPWKS